MLLRLRSDSCSADRDALLALAGELGYRSRFLDEEERLLELRHPSGSGAPADRGKLEERACVAAVLEADDAPELAERADRGDTVVRARDAVFGGGAVSVVAGPCAVEDEGRLLEIARAVRQAGAVLLRGGAFKPRTSPHAFQGLGERGLESLARAREETGLGIVTEVLDPRDVETVAGVADMLQIGSRSMSNAALLHELGGCGKPVLLKRGLAATAREFLLAAEYVLAAGNPDVVLCERGVRGFDNVTRNVLDVGTVAYLKRATHLPVIVDPSHAAGRSDLVLPLAKAGLVAGADGLIVEVHPHPSEVRSDGAQALSFERFAQLMGAAERLVELEGKTLVVAPPRSAPSTREEVVC